VKIALREGRRSRPSSSPSTAVRALRLAALFVYALTILSPVTSRATIGSFQRIKDLPLKETDRIVVDSRAHRFIAVGGGSVNIGNVYLRISLFDDRSLVRTRSVEFAPYLPQVARIGTSPEVFAFDEPHRLLHVVVYRNRSDADNTANPNLMSINVDTLSIVNQPHPIGVFPRGVRLFGASVFGAGTVGLVGQFIPQAYAGGVDVSGAPELFGVFVGEVEAATGKTAWGPHPVRGCQTAISDQDQAAVVLHGTSVFVGCGTGTVGTATAPGTPAVVGIDRADPNDQRLNVLPGSYAGGDSYFDPTAERLLLVGRAGDRPSQAVWVFDIAHEVFVGAIAAGDFSIRGFGFDPKLGRLYISIGRVAEPGQLLVSADRGIDIPQATPYGIDAATGPMAAISSSHTLIVPVEIRPGELAFRAFRDTIPASAFTITQLFDYSSYDSLAADAPQYAGDVQAFGVRLHNVGGSVGAVKNVVYLDGAPYYYPFTNTGLKDGDRDLYLARVNGSHLSQDEASAAAISVDRDDNTDSDWRLLREKLKQDTDWMVARAQCSDFGGRSGDGEGDDATAHCDARGAKLEASARYVTDEAAASLISIGSASSTSNIRLDRKLGLVAEATAEARHVVIADVVRIARITSTVTVSAGGVAGSAKVSFARTIEGVVAGDDTCPGLCDPVEAARMIAEALGAQFRVELPTANAVKTKGGAHAHVLREPWAHQQDVVLSSQDPTELQVPALRLTYTGDNAVASRVIVEFAGAMAGATFLRVEPGAVNEDGGDSGGVPLPIPSVLPKTLTPPVVETDPGAGGIVRRVVKGFKRGWRLAFGMGPRSAALWLVLALPAFLFVRRRQLMALVRVHR
jgi:hypothetical protein